MPILEALSKEKGLQVLFSAGDSGVIWAEPGIDLTLEAVAWTRQERGSGCRCQTAGQVTTTDRIT